MSKDTKKIYAGWTNQDFIREYAASIDRMMIKKERTATTVGGDTYNYLAGDAKLDLPEIFREAWHKVSQNK